MQYLNSDELLLVSGGDDNGGNECYCSYAHYISLNFPKRRPQPEEERKFITKEECFAACKKIICGDKSLDSATYGWYGDFQFYENGMLMSSTFTSDEKC